MGYSLYLSLAFYLDDSVYNNKLLTFINKILNAKKTNNGINILYLDIRKAFDTVAHHILLMKLHECGISGWLLKWFYAYLTNHAQCVCINNQMSDFLPVTPGVL